MSGVRARGRYALTAEDETARAFRSVNRRFEVATRFAQRFGNRLTAALTGGFAARGFLNTLQGLDEIAKLSRQFGISTQFLSEFRGIAQLTGTSLQTLTVGIRSLDRALFNATRGSREQVDAFRLLGVNVAELLQLRPEQRVERLFEALRAIGPGATSGALAQIAFGRAGSELNRVAQLQIGTFQELRAEQRELGRSFSDLTQVEEANDALARVRQEAGSLTDELAVQLSPAIVATSNALRAVLVPVTRLVQRSFTQLTTLIGGVGAGLVALFSGQFRLIPDIARETFDEIRTIQGDILEIITDPGGALGAARRQRARDSGQQTGREFSRGFQEGATSIGGLFADQDTRTIQQAITSLRTLIDLRRQLRSSGRAAVFDVDLQSLLPSQDTREERQLRLLQDIENGVRQNEAVDQLNRIREILERQSTVATLA